MMRNLILATATLLALAGPARAEGDAGEAARLAARNLSEATAALREASAARDRVTALTRTIQAYEDGLVALREGLRRAAIREEAIRRQWDARRDQVARLVGVMTAMENAAGPMLLLHPTGPVGTARSGMILSEVTPALHAEAEILRRDLTEIATLRQLQQNAAQTLEEGLQAAQEARAQLSQAIAERRDLPQKFAERPDELRSIVETIDTLDSFADLLSDTQIGPDEVAQDFSDRQGGLRLPVQGTILRQFNEADAAGVRRPGLLLATRANALVTAPAPATIRYMGPLLDYGNVMILEPEGGYLMVLAGMEVLYGAVGQVIPEGSPLGLMPGGAAGAEEFAAEFLALARDGAGGGQTETLYLEIRRLNRPTDPAEWFAQTEE
ncbi:murein hydrolase activator EnvC family protein [Plastorhodobacter daqingensis]|uniref:Murein hydrolase activator EnvC family protein n=1 Tax=Plastorhodobacter daqingensis TaxID=1387281 RepID=A0ABW2UH30_9RHOB